MVVLVFVEDWAVRSELASRLRGGGHVVLETGSIREAMVALRSDATIRVALLRTHADDAAGLLIADHIRDSRLPIGILMLVKSEEERQACTRRYPRPEYEYCVRSVDDQALAGLVGSSAAGVLGNGPPAGLLFVGSDYERNLLRSWADPRACRWEVWTAKNWREAVVRCSPRARLRDDIEAVVAFRPKRGDWPFGDADFVVVDAGAIGHPALCAADPIRLGVAEIRPDMVVHAVRRVVKARRWPAAARAHDGSLLSVLARGLLAHTRADPRALDDFKTVRFLEEQLAGAPEERAGEILGVKPREARRLARLLRRRLGVTRIDRVTNLLPLIVAGGKTFGFRTAEDYAVCVSRRAFRQARMGTTAFWMWEQKLLGRTDVDLAGMLDCSRAAVSSRCAIHRGRAGAESMFDLLRLAAN